MPGCCGAYVNLPPNADGTAALGSRPSRECKVTRTGQGLATLGLLSGCAYGSVAAAGDLLHRPAGSAHALRAVGDEPLVFATVIFEGIARAD